MLHHVVTDDLHTGWWPTFNLADIYITVGAALIVTGAIGPSRQEPNPIADTIPEALDA